ncbi:hypothetical protein DRQ25_00770 [Candidatus Fermentibacteria bacterium]|nr:MAG: hypothetical protein DRQ25_00770 [Candidatus Fermentibacteria bacterium]
MKFIDDKIIFYKEKISSFARHLEIEVGDIKEPGRFLPQFKTKHWGNECNFSIRLLDDDYDSGVVSEIGDKIQWERAGRKVRMYEKDSDDEDGAFEFEVELAEKPIDNVLRFSIQSKEFRFLYQRPLTQKEIDDGGSQPENTIGSYAVYHKTKKHNLTGGKHYRAGKAFHIYRPWVEDSEGTRVWCDLRIDDVSEELTITIPQEFLDTAVYPILVDPTFGYTSVGAITNIYIANFIANRSIMIGRAATLSEDGTLDSLHAAISSGAPDSDYYVALYREDSAGSGSHDKVAGYEKSYNPDGTFETFTAGDEEIVADDYVFGAVGHGDDSGIGPPPQFAGILADTGGASSNIYSETTSEAGSYNTRKSEDPWTETASTSTTEYSLYATYTVGETTANDSRDSEITGQDSANSNRDAEISGEATDNDNRSAEISGVDTTEDARSAEISGQIADNDSRDAEITGTLGATDNRASEMHGVATDNDFRAAELTGSQEANDARASEIIGEAPANDSRDSEITGEISITDNRDAEITGVAGATNSRDTEISGVATINDARSAEITGQLSANDARSFEITGQVVITDSRDAEITGENVDNDARGAEVNGEAVAEDSRDAEISGEIISNSNRSSEITGTLGATDNRASEMHGVATTNDVRSSEITGVATINSSRSAEISGEINQNDSRDAEITGATLTGNSRGAEISGGLIVTDTRAVEIIGEAIINDFRSAEINGTEQAVDSRASEITGIETVFSSRNSEITGILGSSSSRGAEINGQRVNPYCPLPSPYTPKTSPYTRKEGIYSPYPKRNCN